MNLQPAQRLTPSPEVASRLPVSESPATAALTPSQTAALAADPPQATNPTPNPDRLQTAMANAPARAQLDLKLADQDGFLNFSQGDLKAQVSGKVQLSQDFVLQQLGRLPNTKDIAFKPARFDADKQQYVISGKALDVLAFIDVGFEVRLGVEADQLAFRVNNDIKRGIVYKQIGKQLGKLGLETHTQSGKLLLDPSFARSIDLPLPGGRQGRIEKISASPEQLRFSIDKQGQIWLELKDVEVEISSDTRQSATPGTTPADQAQLKFELSLDHQLKPMVAIQEGMFSTQVEQEQLKSFLNGKAAELVSEQLGSSYRLEASHLQGSLELAEGLKLAAQGELALNSLDTPAQASMALQAEISKENKQFAASQLQAQSAQGAQVTASSLRVTPQAGQLQVEAEGLSGKFASEGLELEARDLSAQMLKQGKDLSISAHGELQGHLQKAELELKVASRGQQQLELTEQTLSVELEQATVNAQGDLNRLKNKPAGAVDTETSSASREIRLEVKDLQADADLQLGQNAIKGQLREGGLSLHKAENLQLSSQGQLSASVSGGRINGQTEVQGFSLQQSNSGLQLEATQHSSSGRFDNGKIAVEGQVSGKASVSVAGGEVKLQHRDGELQAYFQRGEQIAIRGSAGDADFSLRQGNQIELALENPNLQTEVKLKNNQISATTREGKAQLQVNGGAIALQTDNSQSDFKVGIKDNIRIQGQSQDLHLAIDPKDPEQGTSEAIRIQAEAVKASTEVRNRSGSLQIKAQTEADMELEIAGGNQIDLQTRQGKSTAHVQVLQPQSGARKVDAHAQGTDLNLKLRGPDLELALNDAQLQGEITPNAKIAVDLHSTESAAVGVKLQQNRGQGSQVQVQTQAAVAGKVSIDGKVDSQFSNTQGFDLQIQDGPQGKIKAEVKDLEVDGQVKTPGFSADVDGQGDFEITVHNQQGKVEIGYDGQLQGQGQAAQQGKGAYHLQGQSRVEIVKKDARIQHQGQIEIAAEATQLNGRAGIHIDSQQEPLQVQLENKRVSLALNEGGFVELQDLQSLKLGDDPKLTEMLQKLHSRSVKLGYKDLQVGDNGKEIGVTLQSQGIETAYGKIDVAAALQKTSDSLNIEGGKLALTPNRAFYELIQKGLSEKYNIKIQGEPSFENGEIRVKGEVRTPAGLVQLADFQIKATVKDDKLIFDFDRAQVLGVIGTNTVGKLLNRVLSKTDIDVFKRSDRSIEIELADIVKDLSLTQGVNFTGLKLVDNRFEVDFYYSGHDRQAAEVSKKGTVAEIQNFIKAHPLETLSGESLSTLFAGLVRHRDSTAASQLMQTTLNTYLQADNPDSKHELERGLMWMVRSQPAHKAKIEDEIGLNLARSLNPAQATGAAKLRQLPREFVQELADNLDKTITQGGSWQLITQQERQLANQLRQAVGLPLNKRLF